MAGWEAWKGRRGEVPGRKGQKGEQHGAACGSVDGDDGETLIELDDIGLREDLDDASERDLELRGLLHVALEERQDVAAPAVSPIQVDHWPLYTSYSSE